MTLKWSEKYTNLFTPLIKKQMVKKELRELVEFQERIFESIDEPFNIIDRNYRIVRVNKAYAQMRNKETQELIGKYCYEILYEETSVCKGCVVKETFDTAKSCRKEKFITLPDGSQAWLEIHTYPFLDEEGNVASVIEYTRDITERKNAEEEIKLLSESSHKLLEIEEPDDRYDYILKRMLELTGAKVGYVGYIDERTGYLIAPTLTREIWEACKVSGKDIVFKEFTGLWGWGLKNKKSVLCNDIKNDKRSKPPPEGHIEIKNFLSVPCMINDKIVGQIGLANKESGFTEKDLKLVEKHVNLLTITIEKHRAESHLRESEQRYRGIFEGVGEGIFVSTPEGRFLSVNPAMVNIFGFDSIEEMLAIKDIRDAIYLNPKDRDKVMEIYERDGFLKDYELELKKKDGTRINALLTSFAVKDEKGIPIRYEGIVKDITDKKRLEAQLLHAQKMESIGLLAGGIAHHFNNLLTVILGYASLLKEGLTEDSPLRTYVDTILRASKSAVTLTSGLLAYSRRQIMRPMPVKLGDIVYDVKKFLGEIIGEDIELRIFISPEEITVMADPAQIGQVLMNLCTNAKDAMPEGGVLTIRTEPVELDEDYIRSHGFERPGRYMRISVTDTGMGMDKETKGRIFEPFFTTKDVGKGTGLGLAMSYGIVKQHNGYITVYSERGKGTTFRIYLPAIERVIEVAKMPAQPVIEGKETIIIAEDEEVVRDLSRKILEKHGYKVIVAEDGEDTIRKFNEHRDSVGLVILDVVMPKMSGKDVYDEIRRIRPDIKALFISGYAPDAIYKIFGLEPEIDFISKPFLPNDFLIKVREVLDKP